MRTDWLKNLGMELPTDLDSLYEVYYAFTQGSDKDGANDTFGLCANADPTILLQFSGLLVFP